MKISLDLGKVLFDSRERISYGKNSVGKSVPGSVEVIRRWDAAGHELSVISKIDRGQEARVTMSLVHAGIVPFIIDPAEVRFCYSRAEKGVIASMTKPDIHVDDRVEPLNAIHNAGVKWKILFIGVADDRPENGPLLFDQEHGLFIAKTWNEVEDIVSHLSQF